MAQAAAAPTPTDFIAQLLAPLACAKARRQFEAEERAAGERAWMIAMHRYLAAQARRDHFSALRRVAELERRTLDVPERFEEAQAQLDMIAAVDYMMMTPARCVGDVRLKQKKAGVDGGRDRWRAAIADDLARLGKGG